MNSLTPLVIDDDQRFRIASYCPINAFVPVPEDTQYVSDQTGNYWPSRTLDLEFVQQNPQAGERTSDRSVEFRLVDNRPAGQVFPADLWETAVDISAEQVLPQFHVTSRGDMAAPQVTYRFTDPEEIGTLIVPAPPPHGMTLGTIGSLLTSDPTSPHGAGHVPHISDIGIRNASSTYEPGDLLDLVETALGLTRPDVNIHLHDPIINTELISVIRKYPSAIGSVSIPKGAPEYIDVPETPTNSLLSSSGSRDLSDAPCPYVRIAAELSLLTSSFIESEKLPTAIEASVIPRPDTEHQIGTGVPSPNRSQDGGQQTLESLLP